MSNVTRRVMQLTQRNIDKGMSATEARKKALERANFEKEVDTMVHNELSTKCLLGGN